jgi:hypothetical protein
VLDRRTLEEVGRFNVPSRDVFTVLPYDERLANGLRVGASLGVARNLGAPAVLMTGPLRQVDSIARLALLDATTTSATVRMTNLSRAILSGAGTHPVRVGARWRDGSSGAWVDVSRANLPAPLYPNRDVTIHLELPSLPPAGTPLQICVLQEMVRWFDEVSPEAAVELHPGRHS